MSWLVGIGLMSAAFVIAFQQNEPVSGGLVALSFLVSGVLYPLSVMPMWLRSIGELLPLTHAIELARGLLIGTATIQSMGWHFAALAGASLMFPVGVMALSSSLAYARRSGTLGHY
jgi:ABC-2 type transport system permease protein